MPLRSAFMCLLLGLTSACDDARDPVFIQCELDYVVDPAQAAPGELVDVYGRPQSERVDTELRVGGVSTPLEDTFDGGQACGTCETCRDQAGCNPCQTCPSCDEVCASCEPGFSFLVPDGPEGPAPITVTNRFGSSRAVPFTRTAPDAM